MTEEGKSPKTNHGGFSFFLGKRKQRVSHIPTAPAAAILYSKATPKTKAERSLPRPSLRSPSGSSFDWKRLPTEALSKQHSAFSHADSFTSLSRFALLAWMRVK